MERKAISRQKKALLRRNQRSSALRKSNAGFLLANARASETSVVLDAHLPAGQKIGHRSNGLPGALGAGTDCQNEIAEGQFLTRFEDLSVSFHRVALRNVAIQMPVTNSAGLRGIASSAAESNGTSPELQLTYV